MEWYQWMAILSACICLLSLIIHASRVIRLGKPADYAQKKGDPDKAIQYAYTGAMSPIKKESAYMHLPTYLAGLMYHMGTFMSLFIFILVIFNIEVGGILALICSGLLLITGLSGLGILIKRMALQKLRSLSNPDDYISNLLVSVLQLLSGLILIRPEFIIAYYILVSLLFLYIPLGKLRHTVYFFAARYHLGIFYGWRGVWPPK